MRPSRREVLGVWLPLVLALLALWTGVLFVEVLHGHLWRLAAPAGLTVAAAVGFAVRGYTWAYGWVWPWRVFDANRPPDGGGPPQNQEDTPE